MADAVRQISYDRAEDYFDAIVFNQADGRIWRGVSDSSHSLVPRIARPDILTRLAEKRGDLRTSYNVPASASRVDAYEWFLTRSFYNAALEFGLDLPPVSAGLHAKLTSFKKPAIFAHDPREAWPLLARMQHLGIETRLLDWAKRPISALFFASVKGSEEDADIGVYEMPIPMLLRTQAASRFTEPTRDTSDRALFTDALLVYAPSPQANTNMRTQSGLFTAAVSDFGMRSSRLSAVFKWEFCEADMFDHSALWVHLWESWKTWTDRHADRTYHMYYGDVLEFEPLTLHILCKSEVPKLRKRLDAVGISEFSMLREGFSTRELMRRRVDDWLQTDDWT